MGLSASYCETSNMGTFELGKVVQRVILVIVVRNRNYVACSGGIENSD